MSVAFYSFFESWIASNHKTIQSLWIWIITE